MADKKAAKAAINKYDSIVEAAQTDRSAAEKSKHLEEAKLNSYSIKRYLLEKERDNLRKREIVGSGIHSGDGGGLYFNMTIKSEDESVGDSNHQLKYLPSENLDKAEKNEYRQLFEKYISLERSRISRELIDLNSKNSQYQRVYDNISTRPDVEALLAE